ncbi:MAG TPA: hypothetical protein VL200_15410 [Lacunisphaera sp.]|jgi:hypothetical protein|nr:hypothetical protein [Lacunisphaera sp.]
MPSSPRSLFDRFRRHREKGIDGLLLLAAVNVPASLALFPRPSWVAQAILVLLFAAFASPKTHETAGPWGRYLRLLPGYVGAAGAGLALLLWWLALPRSLAWYAPIWLSATALARVALSAPVQNLARRLRASRGEVVGLDLCLLAGFDLAVPAWLGRPGPNFLAAGGLAAAWLAWHGVAGGQDPADATRFQRRSLLVLVLAIAWGALLAPRVGAVPAAIAAFWLGVVLLLARRAVGRFARDPVSGPGEVLRWMGLFLAVAFFFHPFVSATTRGAGDANYYATFLADALLQFRHGIFPVYVGQTEFQFNGSVIPIRVAPGFQYLGGLVDLLTARTLGVAAVQNILITLTGFACAAGSYACLRAMACSARLAWMLAFLFVTCPGVAGLAFNSDLYMSWLAAPFVPVVVYLGWRTFAVNRAWMFAALGFSLGLSWWMHAPVALWLTLVAALAQVVRLIWARPPAERLAGPLLAGAVAFLATSAYPIVSAALYPANPAVGSGGGFVVPADQILQQLQETFPAAWLPLSSFGRLLTDFQLGYGLLLVGLFAAPVAWRTGRPESRVLVAVCALLVLLLLPIPWLNVTLWKLIPGAVRLVTNTWVMQRLYLILAGGLVFVAATAGTNTIRRSGLEWVALAACLWSGAEAVKFVRGSWAVFDPSDVAARHLLPENVTLTRYSYGLFGTKPSYFSHGVTDPALENRLLADDLRTVVGGNPDAAARLAAASGGNEQTFSLADDRLRLPETLKLSAGRRYLAVLSTSVTPFPAATLILKGRTFDRVYGLPEYGEAHSFGLAAGHPPYFPLYTSATAEPVEVVMVPADRAALAELAGRVSLRLEEYDPVALPVQIESWLPYTASVTTPSPAWLETPRMFQRGYRASVNGSPAEVRSSAEGLASLHVPAGRSEVILRYVPPVGLALTFWLSLATIVAGAAALTRAAGRQLTSSPLATGPSAAPGG